MGKTDFLLFLAASLPLVLTPGPDMIYVGLGYVIHTVLAVAGLSALLQGSATAFLAVKYAGAAYLLYLGVKTLLDRSGFASLRGEGETTNDLARILFQGTVTSVLNPKGILFFLAFLPQFVSLSGGSVALQVSVLGSIFALLCLVVYGLVGYFSGGLGETLVRKPRFAGALVGLRAVYSSRWDSGSPSPRRVREEKMCPER